MLIQPTRFNSLANHYLPIWYKQASDTVVPLTKQAVDVSRDFLNTTWVNSEPYRKTASIYYQQGIEYVNEISGYFLNFETIITRAKK